MLNGKSILITGGTGSFGKQAVSYILKNFKPKKLAILSRDELKQFEMQEIFSTAEHECLRYFLGDVRDPERLNHAFRGMDIVIHAAALKQVPAAEYNPYEFIKTNVLGAQNVIQAAIQQRVGKVVALSTDKAASPCNLYGATKLCSDKLFVAGNAMSGDVNTRFSVVRYGNVVGSRGSVIPFFLKKRSDATLPITDLRMTRFSISLDDAVGLVLLALGKMHGGEIFVPKIPSYRIGDLARAINPTADHVNIGIRPGEKLHECMITEDDARQTIEFDRYYVIEPNLAWYKRDQSSLDAHGLPCPEGFTYNSGSNHEFLSVDQLRAIVNIYCKEHGIETV